MTNHYATREQVKRAVSINGADKDPIIDRLIESVSRSIESCTKRFFIPETQTRTYRWPNLIYGHILTLWLDGDLISVTTLQIRAQDSSPTTIPASDFYLEPANHAPPFDRIEIDLSSGSAFESGDTPQRSVSVEGEWGYSDNTAPAGTVSSGLDSDSGATTMVCSNAALIGVGDTLLIESERMFVSDRAFANLASILLNGALTADQTNDTVTVDASHGIQANEVIKVDSEDMYVKAVNGNDLTVIRAYNGSLLAAHADNTQAQINRTLTIERGVNGSTAATHADSTAISKYEVPFDINELCVAEVIAAYSQEQSGWGREIGQGEGQREHNEKALGRLRKEVIGNYKRMRMAAI